MYFVNTQLIRNYWNFFFHDEINIDDPNEEARSKILKIHTKNKQYDAVDFKTIATKTNGYNCGDIKKTLFSGSHKQLSFISGSFKYVNLCIFILFV